MTEKSQKEYARVIARLVSFISRMAYESSLKVFHQLSDDTLEACSKFKADACLENLHELLSNCVFQKKPDDWHRDFFLLFKFLVLESASGMGFKKPCDITQVIAKLQYLCRISVLYELGKRKAE